jgi:hypothetical protein
LFVDETLQELIPEDDHVNVRGVVDLYGKVRDSCPLIFKSTATTFITTLSSTVLLFVSVHFKKYVPVVLTTTDATPEVALFPLQELFPGDAEAEQELTFVEDHTKETVEPLATVIGPSTPLTFKSTDKFPFVFDVQD